MSSNTIVDDWHWQSSARCRSSKYGTRFDTEDPHAMSAAKLVCHDCPVMLICRDYALRAGESFGVWGGLTPQERAQRRYRLPRSGSPRYRMTAETHRMPTSNNPETLTG